MRSPWFTLLPHRTGKVPGWNRALLKTGELRGIQVGVRGEWRIVTHDLEDFIGEAYRRTAEGIAAGELKDDSSRLAAAVR